MDEDDFKPRLKSDFIIKELASLSVDEMKIYIAELQIEISRVEEFIQKRQAHKEAASAFFKN